MPSSLNIAIGTPAAGSGFQWKTSGRFFPDTTTTGVPSGTSLTASGDIHVTTNGTVVDSKLVTGNITIDADNVTVKRCHVIGRISGTAAGGGTGGINGTNFLIQDCELDGGGTDGDDGGITLLWLEDSQGVVERCYLHSAENGGGVGPNSDVTIRDCYIGNMLTELSAEPQPHTDGFEFAGDASGLTIDHCQFQLAKKATSCINFNNEVTGTNSGMTVNNCLFRSTTDLAPTDHTTGYRFAIYFPRFPGWSNIVVTDNIVQQGRNVSVPGDGGYFDSPENCTTFTGNVDYDTGATLTN